jgi:hypothetical protein
MIYTSGDTCAIIYPRHENNKRTEEKIIHLFPQKRGNVKIDTIPFLNALILSLKTAVRRALPEIFRFLAYR